ncbi:hypothetical protein ACKZDW_02155 (plasmid) [Ralstonia syzygii subsp. celebesensis]|uniref:hypothetical protein n=1 Tax=Ralstonia syzygii TaxID=28097 RepID=UPI00387E1A85
MSHELSNADRTVIDRAIRELKLSCNYALADGLRAILNHAGAAPVAEPLECPRCGLTVSPESCYCVEARAPRAKQTEPGADERAAFEAWAKREFDLRADGLTRRGDGYKYTAICDAWAAWKARATQSGQRPGNLSEETIQALWDEACNDSPQNPGWSRHIRFARTIEQAGQRSGVAETAAARDVLAERARQISAEGWTPEHDDEHADGQMALAAGYYALACAFPHERDIGGGRVPSYWPWDKSWWKPRDPRRNLVKAAALVLAEIERLDRAAASHGVQHG